MQKKTNFRSCFAFIIMIFSGLYAVSQTGPGGVGFEDDSEDNQPWNVLWLNAEALDYENGEIVETWEDVSGNGNDALKMDEMGPVFHTQSINGLPCVTFNGANYMAIEDADNLDGGDGLSIFVVVRKKHDNVLGGRKIIAKRKHWNVWSYDPPLSPSDIQYSYGLDYRDTEEGSRIDCHINGNLDNIKNRVSTDDVYGDTTEAHVVNYNYNGNYAFIRVNGISNTYPGGENPRKVAIGPVIEGNADLWIGAAQLDPPGHKSADEGITVESFLNAHIAEIIVYRNGLDSCQIMLVENYLASKYDLKLDSASRFYQDTIYTSHVFGIGTINGNQKHSIASDKILQFQEINESLDAPNEFLMAGSHSIEIAKDTSFTPDTIEYRWSKVWKIEKQGSMDVTLSFDFFEAGMTMDDPDKYVLLYSPTDFTLFSVLPNLADRKFSSLRFVLNNDELKSGYYTLGYLKSGQTIDVPSFDLNASLKIYPNPPKNNVLNLEIWNDYRGEVNVAVFNILGIKIHEEKIKKQTQHFKHILYLPFKNGMYFIQTKFENINQQKVLYFNHF